MPYMQDWTRKRLLGIIEVERKIQPDPMNVLLNQESFFAQFYENGMVKRHINEELEGLDFIQLLYLLKYFQRRLDIALTTRDELDVKYPGNLYENERDADSERKADIKTYDRTKTEEIYYSRHIPLVNKKLVEKLVETFNIAV